MGFTRSALVLGLLVTVAVVTADSGERDGKGPRSGQDPTSGLQNTLKQLGQQESIKLTSMTHYFTALFALLGKLPTAMIQLVQAKARMDMDLLQSFMDGMSGHQSHGNSDVLSGLRETMKQMGQLEGVKLQSLTQYFGALSSFIGLLPQMALQLGGAKINMDLNMAQSLVNGITGGHDIQEMLHNMPSDLGNLLGGSGGGQNGGIGDVLRRLTGGNGSNGGKGGQSSGPLSGMLGGGSGHGGPLSGMMGGGSGHGGPLSGMMGGGSGHGGPLSGMMGGGSGHGGQLSGMMGGGSGHGGPISGMMGGHSGHGGSFSHMMGGGSGHSGSLSGMMGSGHSGMMGGGPSGGGSHGLPQGPNSDRLSHFLSGHNGEHQHSSEENKSD